MELLTPLYQPKFEEAGHIYNVGGECLPSLTGILKGSGIFDMSHFTVEGRERGSRVHRACELLVLGSLDWSTVKEEDAGYVQAWGKFVEETGYQPEFCETPIASMLYRFACKPDGFGMMNNRRVIIEIKTGAENKKYERLQTAGQLLALRENFPKTVFDQRMAVHLRADGTYSVGSPFTKHSYDIEQFRSILVVNSLKSSKE